MCVCLQCVVCVHAHTQINGWIDECRQERAREPLTRFKSTERDRLFHGKLDNTATRYFEFFHDQIYMIKLCMLGCEVL